MLYEHRQLHSLHNNRKHLHRPWKKNQISYFKLCTRKIITYKKEQKKVIELMKDEFGGKIITEFVALRPKTYNYLEDDEDEKKKV